MNWLVSSSLIGMSTYFLVFSPLVYFLVFLLVPVGVLVVSPLVYFVVFLLVPLGVLEVFPLVYFVAFVLVFVIVVVLQLAL